MARGDDDGALVGEGVEAQLAVIMPHARVADPSERHLLVDYVHYAENASCCQFGGWYDSRGGK